MSTKVENIKNYLESKNVKPTYHRIMIMKYLEDSKEHPTAEKIYEDVVKTIPTISKTTVYNTLKVFVEEGIVEELNIAGTTTHYDLSKQDHDHFLCLECGRIYDISPEESLGRNCVDTIEGNKVDEVKCYYKGICKECLEKDN
ncbi:MAG: transcriptional repressor [Candidatus Marinimicrobia bacterium]|nr:transcriptional repressor [Candidatus Neomarinimicrobiota bacterium]